MSVSEKQTVEIVKVLYRGADILILDEPTTGLDPNQLVEIRELIRKVGQTKTVLLSTHIMQEVEAVCSRVIIINNGKLVADDETKHLASGENLEQIFRQMRSQVHRDFLSWRMSLDSLMLFVIVVSPLL